jgi:hypothetical protein
MTAHQGEKIIRIKRRHFICLRSIHSCRFGQLEHGALSHDQLPRELGGGGGRGAVALGVSVLYLYIWALNYFSKHTYS